MVSPSSEAEGNAMGRSNELAARRDVCANVRLPCCINVNLLGGSATALSRRGRKMISEQFGPNDQLVQISAIPLICIKR